MGSDPYSTIVGQEVPDYCGTYRTTIWIFGTILYLLILRKISRDINMLDDTPAI